MKTFRWLVSLICIILLVSLLPLSASAKSNLKAEDFAEVFTTDITWNDTNDGVSVTFGAGRLSYMVPVQLDGLKLVFKQVSLTAPSGDLGTGLWINFGQEPGHYWGIGATGTIFRFTNSVDGVSLYVKKADDMDDAGDDIFLPTTMMGLKSYPISMTLTFNKVGGAYEIAMNGATVTVDAKLIDTTISSSGKGFLNIGIVDPTGSKSNSLVIAEISNSKAPNATTPPSKTNAPTTPPTTPPSKTNAPTTPPTTPTDPVPTDETPTDPVPTDETPTDPVPTDETPTDPAPTNETPTDPTPTEPVKSSETGSVSSSGMTVLIILAAAALLTDVAMVVLLIMLLKKLNAK